MDLLEKKKRLLEELVVSSQIFPFNDMVVDGMFMALSDRCMKLATIVHCGQRDKAGKPYIQHVIRVASHATSLPGYCAALLHDAVEYGKDIGVTIEFLRDKMRFPSVIINMVAALTRNEGESYGEYLARVVRNYLAAKVKIDDSTDNSRISRFDLPTKTDHMRCSSYLEKVWTLKNSSDFQKEAQFDVLNSIIGLSEVARMVTIEDQYHREDGLEWMRWYFGYEGCQSRRLRLTYTARHDEDTGKMRATIIAIPSLETYDKQYIFKPHHQEIFFENAFDANDYLKEMVIRLESCKSIFQAAVPEQLLRTSLPIGIQEQKFSEELDQLYQ